MLNLKQRANLRRELGKNAKALDMLHYDWRSKNYNKMMAIATTMPRFAELNDVYERFENFDNYTLLDRVHTLYALGEYLFATEYEEAYSMMCDYGVEHFINYKQIAIDAETQGSLIGGFTEYGYLIKEN